MTDRHFEAGNDLEAFLGAIAYAALCLDDRDLGEPSTRKFLDHVDRLLGILTRSPQDAKRAERLEKLRARLMTCVAQIEKFELRQGVQERFDEKFRRMIDEEFGESRT